MGESVMQQPWDFGYDHKKKLKLAALQEALRSQGLPVAADEGVLVCLKRLEKFWAEWREADGKNDKTYLKDDFNPNKYTIPKLRQVLSQYNIDYEAASATKAELVQLFIENIDELRFRNGVPVAPRPQRTDAATAAMTTRFNEMTTGPQAHNGARVPQYAASAPSAFCGPIHIQTAASPPISSTPHSMPSLPRVYRNPGAGPTPAMQSQAPDPTMFTCHEPSWTANPKGKAPVYRHDVSATQPTPTAAAVAPTSNPHTPWNGGIARQGGPRTPASNTGQRSSNTPEDVLRNTSNPNAIRNVYEQFGRHHQQDECGFRAQVPTGDPQTVPTQSNHANTRPSYQLKSNTAVGQYPGHSNSALHSTAAASNYPHNCVPPHGQPHPDFTLPHDIPTQHSYPTQASVDPYATNLPATGMPASRAETEAMITRVAEALRQRESGNHQGSADLLEEIARAVRSGS